MVLSDKGWIRHAKGHDVDASSLNYKAGDQFLDSASGKSNQPAVFVGSDGRSYAIESHTLPSARSQGEPITGRINITPGSSIRHVLMADESQFLLMASDAGYGFVCKQADMLSKKS